MEDAESPNSCTIVELSLDEIPSIPSGNSHVPRFLVVDVRSSHVIFNLNGILITTCFQKGGHGKYAFHTIILKPRLKEFLEKILVQFHIYLWSTT
jgi:hypothetical protein